MLGDLNINTLLYQKGNLYGCEPLSWRSDVSMYKFRKPFFAGFEIFPGKRNERKKHILHTWQKYRIKSYRFKRSKFIFSIKKTNERTNIGENYFSISLNITFPTYSHPKELTKGDQKYSFEYYFHILDKHLFLRKNISRELLTTRNRSRITERERLVRFHGPCFA